MHLFFKLIFNSDFLIILAFFAILLLVAEKLFSLRYSAQYPLRLVIKILIITFLFLGIATFFLWRLSIAFQVPLFNTDSIELLRYGIILFIAYSFVLPLWVSMTAKVPFYEIFAFVPIMPIIVWALLLSGFDLFDIVFSVAAYGLAIFVAKLVELAKSKKNFSKD